MMRAIFLVLAAAVSTAAVPPPGGPSFCQRMAAKLPMKEKRVAGIRRVFDMQTMTAAQRWLIGGSTSFSMKLEAVDDTPQERERVARLCEGSPCTVEGPLRFTLGVKNGGIHAFEALPGERARIEMVGTRVRCSDM